MTTINTPERATAIPPLLPCPFCGAPCQHQGNYGDTRDGLHRFVACTKCAANIYRYRQTQNEADAALYEAWNARVNTHDALQAENERLREQVKELPGLFSLMRMSIILLSDAIEIAETNGYLPEMHMWKAHIADLRLAHALLNPQEPNNG